MGVDQAKRLREFEKENGRLKKLVADQVLDITILKVLDEVESAQSGGYWAWDGSRLDW
jgi:hypothetical protein